MTHRVDRKDIRVLVSAVAQFAAGIEAHLRQIEPALTLSQLVALERVVQQPRLRPFQLATQTKISRQLAWQTCKRLQSLGLLSMSNTDAGKRVVEVEATAAGIAHLQQVARLHDAIAAALEAGGEEVEVATLRSGLQRLTAAAARISAEAEGEGPAPRARASARKRTEADAPRRRRRATGGNGGAEGPPRGSGAETSKAD